MAGMLPGVECARRRRFHQNNHSPAGAVAGGSTRKSSFCLYTSNHESFYASTTFPTERSILNKAYEDESLGVVVRQAKERLDERLRTQKKSSSTRVLARGEPVGETKAEVFGLKKSRNDAFKRFNCANFSWKEEV